MRQEKTGIVLKKYGIWFLYVLLLMFFCAESSPFLNNMRTDSAVFFTMGRGMLAGKIPYVDLFDHKGFYIYLVNLLGALLSEKNTIGLFLVETVFMTGNAILYNKIADTWMGEQWSSREKSVFTALMLLFHLNYFIYQGGNYTENYVTFFQLLSMLWVVRFYKSGRKEHLSKEMFLHGLCVGIVLGFRANMIAMWGAIALVILWELLKNRSCKLAFGNILGGLAGIVTGLLPLLVYCLVTGSFREMVEQSLFFNLRYTSSGGSFLGKICSAFGQPKSSWVVLLSIVSLLLVLKNKKVPTSAKAMYGLALLLSLLATAISGRNYGHYFEYLVPFMFPLVMGFAAFLTKKWKAGMWMGLTALFILTVMNNISTPAKVFSLTETARRAEEVEAVSKLYREKYADKKKVLCLNNNCVFYNKFDVIPQLKYFYRPGMNYREFPDAVDAQAEAVLGGENEVVILGYYNYRRKMVFPYGVYNEEILAYLETHYERVCEKGPFEMYIKK